LTGKRLVVGVVLMGIALPAVLFFLLDLQTVSQFFTIAAATFLIWGVADLLASILERPRLRDRSPGAAIREDWERRRTED
jgi:formate-dependent nitrite reductase membrane component NrfD